MQVPKTSSSLTNIISRIRCKWKQLTLTPTKLLHASISQIQPFSICRASQIKTWRKFNIYYLYLTIFYFLATQLKLKSSIMMDQVKNLTLISVKLHLKAQIRHVTIFKIQHMPTKLMDQTAAHHFLLITKATQILLEPKSKQMTTSLLVSSWHLVEQTIAQQAIMVKKAFKFKSTAHKMFWMERKKLILITGQHLRRFQEDLIHQMHACQKLPMSIFQDVQLSVWANLKLSFRNITIYGVPVLSF